MVRLVIAAFIFVALAPAVARADEADALIKQGVELRRAHDDQGALLVFRRAYDLSTTPRALAQIGLAEQALGKWADAETHLGAALELARDPWIAKYQSTLEASRADVGKHLGSLDVRGRPDGAEVRLGGQFVGTLPLHRTLRVPAGPVHLDVTASGFLSETRTLTMEAGQLLHAELVLRPRPPEPDGTTAAAVPLSASAPPSEIDRVAPSADAAASRRRWAKVALWSGVGLAAVGTGALVVRELEARSYDHNNCRETPATTACKERFDTGARARVVGIVGLIGAGVLGATAAVLYLTSPKPAAESADARETRAALACAPVLAPGVAAATCALRF
jgi:hypothetical protein